MKRTESKESVSILEENHALDINISDDKHTIYKVPQNLRHENEKFYTPTSISIGPFHCKNTNLKSNELKSGYLTKFLERVRKNSSRDKAYDVKAVIRAREKDIRSSYSEDISSMGSDELVNMILTDACFIIGFFLGLIDPSEKDPLVKKPWLTEDIKHDLLLLENQLPFFVLDDLFNLAYPTGFRNAPSFVDLAFKFFKKGLLLEINPNIFNDSFNYYLNYQIAHRRLQVFHLNDMLRMLYLPDHLPNRVPQKSPPVKPTCSASQLREVGITFKSCRESITKLQYSSNGVLKIPCFLVSDRTETIIRNVIALEQCHYRDSSFVTDYIILWDHLINTEKDVEMLVQKGIIKNFMGDNIAVASLFNHLCRNVVSTSCNGEYIDLYEKLNKFHNNPLYKYRAILRHEYFSSPWKIASVSAAIVLLFLTLIQTICSVVALFK